MPVGCLAFRIHQLKPLLQFAMIGRVMNLISANRETKCALDLSSCQGLINKLMLTAQLRPTERGLQKAG